MNLCERHRIAVLVFARQSGKTSILKYAASNPDSCPYCLMWTDLSKRGKGKKK